MGDLRQFTPVAIETFHGVNDSSSPLSKEKQRGPLADILDNFELTQDAAMQTRRGAILFDRAARLRMFARAAFLVEDFGVAGNVNAGEHHYVYRFREGNLTGEATLPSPTRSVTLASGRKVLVQIWPQNNPKPWLYGYVELFRSDAGADELSTYHLVTNFSIGLVPLNTSPTGVAPIVYLDNSSDATIGANLALDLTDDGLGLDHAVSSITDFKRRLGGNDIIFTAGKYIKSYERGDKIYDELTADRLNSTVVFQDAVWLVNGKDFLGINSKREVFTMGGPAPLYAPNIIGISGPLDGTYSYVFTWYDDGLAGDATGHPWESGTSPISDEISLTSGGVIVTRNANDTPPSRATHWRLYRTMANGSIEEGMLVATIPVADATYVDIIPDTALTPIFPPFDANDPPSELNLTFIVEMGDRLYGAGNYLSPSTLYWSAKHSPEQWSVLNNRFTLSENDGDPINALAVADGILYVFKGQHVYRMIGDPPQDADRFGLKEGCSSWRACIATKNGIYYHGYNSIFWTNGNTSHNVGDYIATFFKESVDPTHSTMRAPQMVDYADPGQRQLITSFRTMGSGGYNSVAGVYHYNIGCDETGTPGPEGWSFFRDFQVVSMACVVDLRRRDMLLLGDDTGRIFQHNVVKGEDRAEIVNYGAGNAPFVAPSATAGRTWTEPFNALPNTFSINVAPNNAGSVVEINPAGVLHVKLATGVNPLDAAVLSPTSGTPFISDATAVQLTITDLNIATWAGDANGNPPPLFLNLFLTARDETGTLGASIPIIGWSPTGFYYQTYDGTNSVYENWVGVPALTTGADHDIIIKMSSYRIMNTTFTVMEYTQDGAYYGSRTLVDYDPLFGQGFTTYDWSFNFYMDQREVATPLEFTLKEMSAVELTGIARNLATYPIETYTHGTAITFVYESPWFNFDAQHLQKYLRWMYLTAKGTFDGEWTVTLYTDFIDADGQIEQFPIFGGNLWDDDNLWDDAKWDGIRRLVGNRMATDRTGNNIKVRFEIATRGAYAEIFGYTMSLDQIDILEAPRANEGEKR